jgi:hypothetical protein
VLPVNPVVVGHTLFDGPRERASFQGDWNYTIRPRVKQPESAK